VVVQSQRGKRRQTASVGKTAWTVGFTGVTKSHGKRESNSHPEKRRVRHPGAIGGFGPGRTHGDVAFVAGLGWRGGWLVVALRTGGENTAERES
jgi:hypothetical protein